MYLRRNHFDAKRLRDFLAAPERPDNTVTFNELQGFLFVIACAPELVALSEWLPVLFDGEDANYQNQHEAEEILGVILELYNNIQQDVLEGEVGLPRECIPRGNGDASKNLEPGAPVQDWSRGFLRGHAYVEDLWEVNIPQELDQELSSCVLVLSFFADRELAQVYYEDAKSQEGSLNDMAASVLGLLQPAMQSYASIGMHLRETLFAEGKTMQ